MPKPSSLQVRSERAKDGLRNSMMLTSASFSKSAPVGPTWSRGRETRFARLGNCGIPSRGYPPRVDCPLLSNLVH